MSSVATDRRLSSLLTLAVACVCLLAQRPGAGDVLFHGERRSGRVVRCQPLDVDDVIQTGDGLRVMIGASKTDQEGPAASSAFPMASILRALRCGRCAPGRTRRGS
jgi:hypothetical protein